jgi:hypothetical protein
VQYGHSTVPRNDIRNAVIPRNTAPEGLMTAVWISRFLQSKNLKLKNGMEAIFYPAAHWPS